MSQKRLLKLWAKSIAPGVMAAGTLGAVALSGCDTVARLSFSDRVFNDVRVVGFTPEGGACKGSSGDAIIRFVLADGDGNPIDDTTVIGNSPVSLDRNDIEIGDVTLFELPDVACTSEADCSNGVACESTNTSTNVCQLVGQDIAVSTDPKIVSTATTAQAFGVLVENSASIHGALPSPIESIKPDFRTPGTQGFMPDGKSDTVGSEYTITNTARASDGNDARLTAISNLAQTWERVYERAATDNQVRSAFGAWSFQGNKRDVVSAAPGDAQWVYSATGARETARELQNIGSSKSVAAVYESIIEVIEADDKFGQFGAGDEKILTVVVDGPDDLRLPALDAQKVIESANAANVRIFFVHFDPEVQTRTNSGDVLIPDVTTYVQPQDAECSSDDDCKNFEACRQVTAFANSEGVNVTTPAGKIEGTYCAIDYDPVSDTTGRIGPISEYSEIACATGGGYLYFPSLTKLSDGGGTVAKLPLALDSLWEVGVTVSSFDRQTVPVNEPYKVGMVFSATVDDTQKRQNMTEDLFSARPVLFSAE